MRSAFELGPFCFLKSWADDGVGDEQRTFDEHAVAGEEGDLFVVGHVRELVLEAELFVEAAAGIEKAFERQAAGGDPLGEFVVGWVVVDDGAQVAVDVVFFEPFQRFSAGGAFCVVENEWFHVNSPSGDDKMVKDRRGSVLISVYHEWASAKSDESVYNPVTIRQ